MQLAACSLLLPGCVSRSLTIRTDPPGAKVYVNDVLKGESPVTYDFEWYGWHRLTIRKEGFERLDDRTMLRAPVYLWIPLDLVIELLPFPIRDRRTWSYTLTPATAPPTPVPPPAPATTKGGPREALAPSSAGPSTSIEIQAEVPPEERPAPATEERPGPGQEPSDEPR